VLAVFRLLRSGKPCFGRRIGVAFTHAESYHSDTDAQTRLTNCAREDSFFVMPCSARVGGEVRFLAATALPKPFAPVAF
jgi:hypothetical protein